MTETLASAAGMPENTRRIYEARWREFADWCAGNGRTALPANTETLTDYITWLHRDRPARDRRGNIIPGAAGADPSMVRQARQAIIRTHEAAGLPCDEQSLLPVKDLAGARRPRPESRKARPVTREELRELATTGMAGAGETIAARDRAMLLLGFHAAADASGLAAASTGDVQVTDYGLLVSLREITAISEEHAPMTVQAVRDWIMVLKGHGREAGPLFPRITKSGVITGDRMGARSIGERIRLAAAAAGLGGDVTAHSMRLGIDGHGPLNGAGI